MQWVRIFGWQRYANVKTNPRLPGKLYKEVAEARYWYYSARAKAILGVGRSELEPKALQDAELPERQACPPQVSMLMELRLYEDAIPQLDHHINTASLPEQECFHDLIACYEGLAMYDKARKVTEKSLGESPLSRMPHARIWRNFSINSTRATMLTLLRSMLRGITSDTFLIAAMILEESRYNAEAVSWAGAIGLMQIMPATGRELAQKLKIRRFRTSMLKQPDINIRMGTKYIGELNSWFDGNAMLVIGAYNGGPGGHGAMGVNEKY